MAIGNAQNDNTKTPFKIIYLDNDHKIGGPVILILGLLVSLWSNCILVSATTKDIYSVPYLSQLIINTAQLSHFLIAASGVVGVYYGLKEKDAAYLSPWLVTKLFEGLGLFVGSIVVATGSQRFIGLMPVGIIFLLVDMYIFVGVWNTYKKFSSKSTPEENPEEPPAYDIFINHNNQTRNT